MSKNPVEAVFGDVVSGLVALPMKGRLSDEVFAVATPAIALAGSGKGSLSRVSKAPRCQSTKNAE